MASLAAGHLVEPSRTFASQVAVSTSGAPLGNVLVRDFDEGLACRCERQPRLSLEATFLVARSVRSLLVGTWIVRTRGESPAAVWVQ